MGVTRTVLACNMEHLSNDKLCSPESEASTYADSISSEDIECPLSPSKFSVEECWLSDYVDDDEQECDVDLADLEAMRAKFMQENKRSDEVFGMTRANGNFWEADGRYFSIAELRDELED
jgi:hypothetical protein